MKAEADPDDILVVAWFEEARLYPQFKNSQIFPVSQPAKLQGKRFRVAWYTPPAWHASAPRFWSQIYQETVLGSAETRPISDYSEAE